MTEKPLILAVKVRDLRKNQAMTQEALAEHLGISRQSVIALENGRYLPSLPIALALAELFRRPLDEIFICDEDELADLQSLLPVLYPPVNMIVEGTNFILEVMVPGYTRDDVLVTAQERQLVVVGRSSRTQRRRYLTREALTPPFERVIPLPLDVDFEHVTAQVEHGILTVTLPIKRPEQKQVIIT